MSAVFFVGREARAAAALLVLVALLSLPLPAPGGIPLSPTEQRLLRQGAIVFRRDLPAGGRRDDAMGGTALALLHADPDSVWRVLVDFPSHAGLFPRVKESAVLERGADRTLVRYLVAVGPFTFRFFVNNYADPSAHLLRWQLDLGRDNHLFRDHWGFWKVEPWEGGVLVTYAMAGRTTLPAFLTRGAGQDGAVGTLQALKARVEGDVLKGPAGSGKASVWPGSKGKAGRITGS